MASPVPETKLSGTGRCQTLSLKYCACCEPERSEWFIAISYIGSLKFMATPSVSGNKHNEWFMPCTGP
jgi:hypothetical protein